MRGFTLHKIYSYHSLYHMELDFGMMIYKDGSGDFFHFTQGDVVHIPTVDVVNLGGFPNPQVYDNIRHDVIHVWFYWYTRRTLSPNHAKLLNIADTPLWRSHWEEYKVESLELYIRSGVQREELDCYDQAKEFWEWVLQALHS